MDKSATAINMTIISIFVQIGALKNVEPLESVVVSDLIILAGGVS